MKLRLLLLSPFLGYAVAQGAAKTREEMTVEERATYDMQAGLMGLKEAGKRFLIRYVVVFSGYCSYLLCFMHTNLCYVHKNDAVASIKSRSIGTNDGGLE